MNISRENIDELNAVVKVDIEKEDYQPKVIKILKDYRKTANIPGFRKGRVPMGLIKKQYGQAVLVDEVNKLLQENLNKYITDESLEVLGNPLPKEQKDFSWEEENYKFEFELGLAPDFEVSLDTKEPVPYYKIVADKETLDKQIKEIRSQYGKLKPKDKVESENDQLTGAFKNEEKEIDHETTIYLDILKNKEDFENFKGAEVGDAVSVNTKDIFKEDHLLARHLDIEPEEAKDLDITVTFEISEINEQELAELNEELFKKVFANEEIKTEEEFRNRLKGDIEKQFEQQSEQQFLNDITETLIEETEFDLPHEFLKKWIQTSGEKELSAEEAKEEYQRSEKGLRFQLIENQIMKDNDITVELEDVMKSTKERIKMQMAQFGQMNPSEEEIDNIARRVLSNEQEAKNASDQVKNEKLLSFYKESANLKEKEVTFDEFIEKVTE